MVWSPVMPRSAGERRRVEHRQANGASCPDQSERAGQQDAIRPVGPGRTGWQQIKGRPAAVGLESRRRDRRPVDRIAGFEVANAPTVGQPMAGRDVDHPPVRQDEMDDLVRWRDRGRADLGHPPCDAQPGRVRRPDRHAGSQVLHRTLAIRGRDPRPSGEADRTRRRTRWITPSDGDRPGGVDGAGHVEAGRAARPGGRDVVETEVSVDLCQREGAEHLPVAVDGEDLVCRRGGGRVDPEVGHDRRIGRGVGLDRCEVLGGEGRFVVASDGMEVRIAEQRTAEPVNESIAQVGPVEGSDRCHRRRDGDGTRRGAWLDRRAGSGGGGPGSRRDPGGTRGRGGAQARTAARDQER